MTTEEQTNVAAGGSPLPPIGLIGLGRMGRPICANLVRAGYPVTVNDVRAEREAVALRRGARRPPASHFAPDDARHAARRPVRRSVPGATVRPTSRAGPGGASRNG
jgi:hypothetical protein